MLIKWEDVLDLWSRWLQHTVPSSFFVIQTVGKCPTTLRPEALPEASVILPAQKNIPSSVILNQSEMFSPLLLSSWREHEVRLMWNKEERENWAFYRGVWEAVMENSRYWEQGIYWVREPYLCPGYAVLRCSLCCYVRMWSCHHTQKFSLSFSLSLFLSFPLSLSLSLSLSLLQW